MMKKINFKIFVFLFFILSAFIIFPSKIRANSVACPGVDQVLGGSEFRNITVACESITHTCGTKGAGMVDTITGVTGVGYPVGYPYCKGKAGYSDIWSTNYIIVSTEETIGALQQLIQLQPLKEGSVLPKPDFVSISDFALIKEANKDYVVFLKSIYDWGIGLVGVLAFMMMTYGGILYMVSGTVDQKGKAKGIITDALVGLALALASFLILNIIRPQALEIKKAEEGFTIVPITPIDTAGTGEQPYTSQGTGEQCLTYPQLQSLADQGYTCGAVTVGDLDCPRDINNPQGSFICTPPSE